MRAAICTGAARCVGIPLVSLLAGPDGPAAYVLVWNEELGFLAGPIDLGAPAAVGQVLASVHSSALALLVLAGAVLLGVR